jgi:hypothetical protein
MSLLHSDLALIQDMYVWPQYSLYTYIEMSLCTPQVSTIIMSVKIKIYIFKNEEDIHGCSHIHIKWFWTHKDYMYEYAHICIYTCKSSEHAQAWGDKCVQPCLHIWVLVSQIGVGPTQMALLQPNHVCKGPDCKCSCILRHGGLGWRHSNKGANSVYERERKKVKWSLFF